MAKAQLHGTCHVPVQGETYLVLPHELLTLRRCLLEPPCYVAAGAWWLQETTAFDVEPIPSSAALLGASKLLLCGVLHSFLLPLEPSRANERHTILKPEGYTTSRKYKV